MGENINTFCKLILIGVDELKEGKINEVFTVLNMIFTQKRVLGAMFSTLVGVALTLSNFFKGPLKMERKLTWFA